MGRNRSKKSKVRPIKRPLKRSKVKVSSNKKVKNALPTKSSDGKLFRSALEAFTYQELNKADIQGFGYENSKFVIQDSFSYPSDSYELRANGEFSNISQTVRAITYTPDFCHINDETREGWIIEVKGFATDAFKLRWKMFKKFLADNNYNLTLFKPHNQKQVIECINIIKRRYYNVQGVNRSPGGDN